MTRPVQDESKQLMEFLGLKDVALVATELRLADGSSIDCDVVSNISVADDGQFNITPLMVVVNDELFGALLDPSMEVA